MKRIVFAVAVLTFAITPLVQADLRMPCKLNFYDYLGRGLANIAWAPAEILDSTHEMTLVEGGTVGYTKGLVQGTSRMVMDVFVGVVEILLSPVAPAVNADLKQPNYETLQRDVYPPADLLYNWY